MEFLTARWSFLTAQYRKLLATSTTQAKDLETLKSTFNEQPGKVDSLKFKPWSMAKIRQSSLASNADEPHKEANELRISIELKCFFFQNSFQDSAYSWLLWSKKRQMKM